MAKLAAIGCAMALVLAAGRAGAETLPRYIIEQGGVKMEISAPRADIVRIREGQGALPEDASWAVAPKLRAGTVPLDVATTGTTTTLRTSAIVVTVDNSTLAVTVSDTQGRVIVADARPVTFDGKSFLIRKAMPTDEHYFGLGDKTGPLDRRGESFALWNTDAYGFGTNGDPIYKSIPFVVGLNESGQAFGLFMDNTFRSHFDFGQGERDVWQMGAEGGPVDYYVMAGPDPKAVVQEYTYLTGTAPLTPEWALGFQQSHYSYMNAGELEGIADRLRADHIPSDALYLDIDYQDRNRPFTVNTQAFPDMAALTAKLKSQNLHLVLITDLHVADAPDQGYKPYDTGIAADAFLKNPDGSVFVGPVWPGPAVFPDFSRPDARAWWGSQYTDFVKDGVSGFWNDMNEPAVFDTPTKTMPLNVVHRIDEPGFAPRTATQAEMHNVYGMLNSRATYDGLKKLSPDQRPFVLTRASYSGGQRYAATWTGDNTSSWAHLSLSISQLVNLGLSGFAYAGDDIGGFTGDAPSPELLTRWIEVGAFNPIMRDHYGKGRPPQEVWVHGPEQEAIRRRYIEERYRLMPYIYALADENSRDGLPIMRPVFLEFPKFGGAVNQFMLGDNLLIAPPATWESPAAYDIPLPGEGWYDYWTGARLDKAGTTETPQLDRLPVFVRPGAIIPKQPLVQSTSETPSGALELHIYPGADCHGAIYLDDGLSYGYTRGQYLRQTITCSDDGKNFLISFGKRDGGYKPWWTGYMLVIHGWNGMTATVRVAGKKIMGQTGSGTLTMALPDIAKAITIAIPHS